MLKMQLEICTGTSCHLLGSYDLYQVAEKLQRQNEENLEVSVVSCLGKCGQGPNVKFNGTIYSKVTPEQLKKMIIQGLKK